MATHRSLLAWSIPRTEEPGGLRWVGSQSRTRPRDAARTLDVSLYLLVGLLSPRPLGPVVLETGLRRCRPPLCFPCLEQRLARRPHIITIG